MNTGRFTIAELVLKCTHFNLLKCQEVFFLHVLVHIEGLPFLLPFSSETEEICENVRRCSEHIGRSEAPINGGLSGSGCQV